MAPPCQALGLRRTPLEPKREAGLLHHGQPKTVYFPRFLPTLELAAHHHIKMLNRPPEIREHLICNHHRVQPPIDHTDSRCRFHSTREVLSD
jgi:hypothetical protein